MAGADRLVFLVMADSTVLPFGHALIAEIPSHHCRTRSPWRLARPGHGHRGQTGLARCGSNSKRTPPPT